MRITLCICALIVTGCSAPTAPDMAGPSAACMAVAVISDAPADLSVFDGPAIRPAVHVAHDCPCAECKCDPCGCPAAEAGETQDESLRVEPVASRRVRVCGPGGCRWVEIPVADESGNAEAKPAAKQPARTCYTPSRPTPVRNFFRRLLGR
jgi:hypothetical protein